MNETTRRLRSTAIAMALPFLAIACIGGELPTESSRWGIGEDPDCDPGSDQCWSEVDRATLTGITNSLNEVLAAAPAERPALLRSILGRIRGLSHKLDDLELAAVAEDEEHLAQAAPELSDDATADLVASLRHRALHRLEDGMISAEMVPVEESIVDVVEGDPCEDAAVGCAAGAVLPVSIPESYAPGTRQALEQIAGSSLAGKVVATMLITNGSLDMDYEVENARLFGEYDEGSHAIRDSGLSPAARVDRIVARARQLAGWAGAVAGAESLVPLAGIGISIGHEEWMLFEIHSKMVFRIAQVYGWDVKDGPALVSAVALILGDGLLLEGTDIVLSNIALPLVVRKLAPRFGMQTADQMVRAMTADFSRRILSIISAKARKRLTSEVVRDGAKAVARQLFGWITFGATVAVSAGTAYWFTDVMGRRAAATAKRWLGDLLHEGSTYLGRDEARECAFALQARLASADGRIADLERTLFQALMGSEYWVSETLHWPMSHAEQVEHASRLRQVWADRSDSSAGAATDACIESAFVDADEQHRMTLLAFLYGMIQIDGDETAAERDLYRGYRARLRGSMFRRIDEDLMDQIERTILAEIRLPTADVAAEYGIVITDVVPALAPQADSAAAYAEAGGP